MAALNTTSFDPVLKSHYTHQRIRALADIKNPFYGLVRRDPKAGGKHFVQPVDFENPQGGNADIAVAITNQGASKYEDFVITRKKHYQIGYIDNETIEASMQEENAFFKALKEVDKAFKAAGKSIARKLFRTAGGYLGRIETGTTLGGTTINLDDHADAFNFQVGMEIGLSGDPGTGSLRGTPTYIGVTDINREGGTLTVDAAISSISGAADTDYIFVQGDHAACPSGLADWIPATAPTSTAFYGVDRTTDSDRLGGLRRDAGGEPLLESLIKGTATVEKHGGTPSHAFMNPETLSDLLLELKGKSQYEMTRLKGKAKIGYKGAVVQCGSNEVVCIGDINCPSNKIYILQLDTWTLLSAGSCPMFLKRSTLFQEHPTADAYYVRVGGYFNLGCSAPGYNLVVNL